MADTLPITVQSTAGVATVVNQGATGALMLAANPARRGATIENGATATLYVVLGPTASLSQFDVPMVQGAYYEVPFGYVGPVSGIWAVGGSGTAQVKELL